MRPKAKGWLVHYSYTLEAVFHDEGRAEKFAVDSHASEIEPLFPLTREQLEWLDKMPDTPELLKP